MVSSLRTYPNYFSYANELWGGSQNLSKHLPWTDLDQTFWQVSHYMEQHPNTPCWVASDWYVPVEKYNVPCTQMGNRWGYELPVRMKGIVFVSSSWLRIDGQPGGALAPFSAVEPKARLGGSAMLVYEGEFDTPVAAARALDNEAGVLFASGQHAEALPLTKRAAELAPEMMGAHESYCRSLAFNDRPEEALVECDAARKLALQEPWNQGQAQEAVRHMKYIAKRFGVPLPPGVE